jgi:hypothetical protein
MKAATNFAELFPDWNEPNRGPGVSYCVAPNARMFDYELLLAGERSLRGCIRAIDKKDAIRILNNRHPNCSIVQVGPGRRIAPKSKKA